MRPQTIQIYLPFDDPRSLRVADITTTHADAILAALGIETFVNADYIARGLSGRNTDAVAFEAERIMLNRLRQLGQAKADFAFESTLSSRTFAAFMMCPQMWCGGALAEA